jgi:hypothetical protein
LNWFFSKKPNRNQQVSVFLFKNLVWLLFFIKTKLNRNLLVSVWFFRKKPVQTGLARFFMV